MLCIQHPRVAEIPEYLLNGAAAVLLHREQAAEHSQCLLGETPPLRWHRVCPPPLPVDELLIERIGGKRLLPREIASQHAEEQYTKGPDIGAVVHTETLLAGGIAKLWGRVGNGATHLGRKANRSGPSQGKEPIATKKIQR